MRPLSALKRILPSFSAKRYCSAGVGIMLTAALSAQNFSFGTSVNPQGNTVEVDSYGFIIDGHHSIPVMGEIHYSRVPESDWRREVRKMKAGGISILSTYVFWIHHEAEEGKWDWSGNRNLHRFLQICNEEHMPVVLRVGPFCHGEVYQGGFPTWLVQKSLSDPKQYKLRSTAPGFLAATQRLYSNIYAQASDMLWKHGGPIIGMQIENESRGPWPYLMALKNMATSIGFDVPFYTRTGWPKLNGPEEFGKLLPLYGDYADGFWDRSLKDMPGDYPKAFEMKDSRLSTVIATETFSKEELKDTPSSSSSTYPYLTCELGGGMMPAYHRRINMSGNEAFPLAICKVGSGSNLPGYYMYHGGTNPYNPAHTMAETQDSPVTNYNDMPLISYDFQAPLGEMGQPLTTSFHQTRWFHQFLADWGEELSVCPVDTLAPHYARRGAFEFFNDYVRILNEEGSSYVSLKDWNDGTNTLTTIGVQPFARLDNAYYFISVKGAKKHQILINGKAYTLKADKPLTLRGTTYLLLSPSKAEAAFVIDGKMHYAQHGGILYKTDKGIAEEAWEETTLSASLTQSVKNTYLREIKMGSQKVAAMPTDSDFGAAEVWRITLPDLSAEDTSNLFLRISYKGDVARLYSGSTLVEDNFWNGKPMLVRVADLFPVPQGSTSQNNELKDILLKILPLGKDAPIYLQKEQKAILSQAPDGILLTLDDVKIIKRNTYE